MTFVRDRVICDGCGDGFPHQEYMEALDPSMAPWVSASVSVRGYCIVLTFCPICAAEGEMAIPRAAEIVRRVKEILR